MYKAIIFDFFGVFCPDISMNWFKKTVPNSNDKLSKFQDICTKSDYGELSKPEFYDEVAMLANVTVGSAIAGVEAEIHINAPLVKYVNELQARGYLTACLSNETHEWTLELINKQGLSNLFNEIVLSADLGIVKPSPEIYIHTLEKLNVAASEAIFVDDRKINTDSAQELGIRSLIFIDTPTFIKEFEQMIKTSYIIDGPL